MKTANTKKSKCGWRGFFNQYKLLTILTLISTIIALSYVFATNLPELFPFAGALFSLVNSLALAIIANCIFCYFQIYIPTCREKDKIKDSLTGSLKRILSLIADSFERIYKQRYQNERPFDMMSKSELENLFNGFNLQSLFDLHYLDCSGRLCSAFAWQNMYSNCQKTHEEIERVIRLLGNYMEGDIISLLLDIDRSSYISTILILNNSGTLKKITTFDCSESIIDLQSLYMKLKNYIVDISEC